MPVSRIFDMHEYQLQNYPLEDAIVSKVNGQWEKISTESFIHQANQLSIGLLQAGIKPGDKIAMVSNNRSEWHITDLAVLQIGAVNVPIYPNITEKDYEYILNDAGVNMIFVSDIELFNTISSVQKSFPNLKVYTYDEIEGANHWSSLIVKDANDFSEIETIKNTIKESDLATLIYTSGTTGNPKGVMLSHKNLVSNVASSISRFPCTPGAKALSFLPICHVYERMISYLYIYKGVSMYYAESMDTIGDNLKEIKPEVFTAVPRLLEKIYDKIVAKGKTLKGIKRFLFFWALDLGHRYELNRANGWWYEFQLKLANKIIFSKWREALGGNVRVVASGSAALQTRLARVFLAAQVKVMEGYGLTETSPVVAVNCEDKNAVMIGTVGKPIDNVSVKIAEDGEILVKGPNVMMGYYNKPEATKKVLGDDGWFHTGDIGKLIDGEFLKITDRKKEIFKTSGGKYIAPQLMENKFKESLFIEQIMVIGEGEKHPAALIQPSFEFLEEWCKRKDISFKNKSDLVQNERVIARISREVKSTNETFSNYEQVKKFELCSEVWSIDGGEITPTLKLKRKNILNKYSNLYRKIYPEQ